MKKKFDGKGVFSMKYAVSIQADINIRNSADCILLSPHQYNLIDQTADKYYIFDVSSTVSKSNYNILNKIKETVTSYTLLCNDFNTMLELMKDGFKCAWRYTLTNQEALYNLLQFENITDVFIDGSLAFNKEVYNLIHKYGKKVWVTPYRSSSAIAMGEQQKQQSRSFYIRPEDSHFYDDLIDYFCFFYGKDQSQLDMLFEIYKKQRFDGSISLIIHQLNGETAVQNTFLPQNFALNRINCKQRCKLTENCNYCETAFILASQIKKVAKKNSI